MQVAECPWPGLALAVLMGCINSTQGARKGLILPQNQALIPFAGFRLPEKTLNTNKGAPVIPRLLSGLDE